MPDTIEPEDSTRSALELKSTNATRLGAINKRANRVNLKKANEKNKSLSSKFKIEKENLGLWQTIKKKLLAGKLGMKLETHDLPDNAKIAEEKSDVLSFSASSKRDEDLTEFDWKLSEFQKKDKRKELFNYQTQWSSLTENQRKNLEEDLKKALGANTDILSKSLNTMMSNTEFLKDTINKVVLDADYLNNKEKHNFYLTSTAIAFDVLFKIHGTQGVDFKNVGVAGGQGRMIIYIPIYQDDEFKDIAERIFHLKSAMGSSCNPAQASNLAQRILKAEDIDISKVMPKNIDTQSTNFPNFPVNDSLSDNNPSKTPTNSNNINNGRNGGTPQVTY